MNIPPVGTRLILDQGMPRNATALLRDAGMVCEHVGELGLSRAEDTAILELAGKGTQWWLLWTPIFMQCWRYPWRPAHP